MKVAALQRRRKLARRIPGEAGVWVLIFADLAVFGIFFVTILDYRGSEPRIFALSQPALNRGLGLANTVLLLVSSLFVAIATHRVREKRPLASRFFVAAILCGLCFVGVKVVEYAEKFQAGIDPTTNDFFTLYFGFTGIHLVHVLAGLGALTFLAFASRRPDASESQLVLIECGATFWHLVDLLWLILFSLFYLIQ